MQIFVSLPSGTTTLEVEQEDSVSILRSKIEAKEGVAADLLRLIFAGRQLEDGQTLADCSVGKEDTVIAVLRLFGGRGHGLVETTIDLEQLQEAAHCCPGGAAAGGTPAGRPRDEDTARYLDSASDDIFADLPAGDSLFSGPPMLGGLPSFSRGTSMQWDQSDTDFWASVDSPSSCATAEDSNAATNDALSHTATPCFTPEEEPVEIEMKDEPEPEPEPEPAPAPTRARAPARQARAARAVLVQTAIPENPKLIQKSHKGLSYNLDEVDDKLRKRLLKNRQSAERSRQRKNAERKTLEEHLEQKTSENEALQQELERMRALLEKHGISY